MNTKALHAAIFTLALSVYGAPAPGPSIPPSRTAAGEDPELVLHEWGVITVPYGATWANLRTEGASKTKDLEVVAGLPEFVPTWEKTVGKEIREWERRPILITKPIIYFYVPKKTTIDLKVSFPTGRPSAWWPPTDNYGPRPSLPSRHGGMRFKIPKTPKIEEIEPKRGFLRWNSLILDRAITDFPKADGWWKKARKTDSVPIQRGNHKEKYLFYDGLVVYHPDCEITWENDATVRLENKREGPLGPTFAIRVHKGVCSSAFRPSIAPAAREKIILKPGAPETLCDELIRAGLYRKEAETLVEIWEQEWFSLEGARVVTILPRGEYDALLPLEVDPEPKELKRVLLVHIECLDVRRAAEVARLIKKLGSDEIEVREEAYIALKKMKSLVERPLRVALEESEDPEIRSRCGQLLQELGIPKSAPR